MKPIPPGFCEAADNAVIPGRPWWRAEGLDYIRRDGRAVSIRHPLNPLDWTYRGEIYATPDEARAAVERIDAEHPLPHPGFRAGQVWLVGTTTWICTDAWVDGPRRRVLPHNVTMDGAFLLHDPLMPSKAPWGPT